MKTNFNRKITSIIEAKCYLFDLHTNREAYHPEDDAEDICWALPPTQKPTVKEIREMNRLKEEIYQFFDVEKFDPCGFFLDLIKENWTTIYLPSIDAIMSAPDDRPEFYFNNVMADLLPDDYLKKVSKADQQLAWNTFKYDIDPFIMLDTTTYTLPEWWASALINDDRSGMSDEDEAEIDKFLAKLPSGYFVTSEGEPYFTHGHDANRNQGATVLDFTFVLNTK